MAHQVGDLRPRGGVDVLEGHGGCCSMKPILASLACGEGGVGWGGVGWAGLGWVG